MRDNWMIYESNKINRRIELRTKINHFCCLFQKFNKTLFPVIEIKSSRGLTFISPRTLSSNFFFNIFERVFCLCFFEL